MPNASSARPWWCDGGRGVVFRGSEHLARPPGNPPQMPDGSAWPWSGVQKFKVQKARSSKGSEFRRLGVQKAQQAEKVLTSSKTGKVPVLCSADVGSPLRSSMEAPLRSSIEAQKRQGRGSEARPERAGAGKIPPRYAAL